MMKERNPSTHNILISLADDFTPEARKLAKDNDVHLISGVELASLHFGYEGYSTFEPSAK